MQPFPVWIKSNSVHFDSTVWR